MGVDGKEDGLEAREGAMARAGEVDGSKGGEKAEDNEVEVRVGGVEGVVEPGAKAVVDGARVGAAA